MKRSIVISLFFHIIFFSFLFFNNLKNDVEPIPLIIDISSDINNSSTPKINKRKPLKYSLKNLFPPSFHYNKNLNDIDLPTGFSTNKTNNEWSLSTSYNSKDSALADFGDMKVADINFIKSLWTSIDKSIFESPLLAEYGHAGKAFFQFEISAEGDLVNSSLKVNSENNILKVLAIRSIRKSLQDGSLKPTKKIVINAQFNWTEHSNCKKTTRFHKNYLSFCRYSTRTRKTFTAAEAATTYLNALTYGPGAIDEIKDYNRQKNRHENSFDPFEALKEDPDYFLGS